MKKTETVQLLAVINAAFPNMQVTEAMVSLWHELLGDLNFGLVKAAVKKLLLESPYPPTIADIRRQAVEIATPPEDRIDVAEAWGEVERAIRLYGYYREAEALASMSPRTAKVVKYMGWQEICLSEEPGVIRGQFLKMYAQVSEREQKERLLPASLKEDIKRLSEDMSMKMLEGGKKEDEEHWLAIQ
jgi:hypothetical protein